jgi:gamma-glutamylcyclotransferase (GGCT)/AIG2-like uncharacterized protein YtfP
MLYLAYGSNMSPAQMQRRCPGARLIGAVVLDGYRLTFTGWSGMWSGGVATIERAPGDQVAGAVYEISAAHLATLDRCEGVPFAYTRCRRQVAVGDAVRRPWVYVKQDQTKNLPSQAYVDRIAEGYLALGLPLGHLQDAIDHTFDVVEQEYQAQHAQQQELPF